MSKSLLISGVVVAGLVLAGCSDDGSVEEDVQAAPSTVISPNDEEPSSAESVDVWPSAPELAELRPCELATVDDVSAAYEVTVEEQSTGGRTSDERGLVWKGKTCSWETDDVIEVSLAVSVAEDFPGGLLACPPLSYLGTDGTPVEQLPSDAWWVGSDFNEEEGTLRVCTDTHTIDIEADRPTGTVPLDTLRDQTVVLARTVLASLDA